MLQVTFSSDPKVKRAPPLTALLLLTACSVVAGQSGLVGCSQTRSLEVGQVNQITNIYTGPSYTCFYKFYAPIGYKLRIACSNTLKIITQGAPCETHALTVKNNSYCESSSAWDNQYNEANPALFYIRADTSTDTGSYNCLVDLGVNYCSCGRLKTVSGQYNYMIH